MLLLGVAFTSPAQVVGLDIGNDDLVASKRVFLLLNPTHIKLVAVVDF
jgi:hypothetical protein